MMSWILCIVVGVGIGLFIAALAKKDKERDYTAIFTQENPHLERRIDTLFDGVKSRFSRK